MSVEALAGFLSGPYGIIADVKMLNFFRHLGQTGAIVLAALTLFSLLVQNFWCRYLCPYGALVGLAALFSPARIRREPEPCIDCGKCAKACPAWLPVDRLVEIRSAECTACMECVAVCPAQGALQLSVLKGARYSPGPRLLGRKGTITPWAMAACSLRFFSGWLGTLVSAATGKPAFPMRFICGWYPMRTRKATPECSLAGDRRQACGFLVERAFRRG
jgi:Fe-S-cluster-containing hydrogenase component 2